MKTALQLAQEYASLVRAKLGSHVKSIILFGSQARGDATEKSDYDVVVVLDQKSAAVRENILDAGTEMLNRYDRLFAALVYDELEWSRTRRFPLGWNIEQEGVAV
jgi:predicted nucleotidyltransferase